MTQRAESLRAKSLRRLAAVQEQMVRLAEWRAATAERACRELRDDRERLRDYVVTEGALGERLARSALASLHGLDGELAAAERRRDATTAALTAARQREHVVDALAETALTEARRAEERTELAATIETWLVARGTSLP